MKKISIGFDLGIASIGWSIYDIEENVIVDKGVKLFNQSKKAEDRRLSRSLRRRYKRKNHRIERFKLLLDEYGVELHNSPDNNLVDKRITGLYDEIDIKDLMNILIFFLRFRGYYPVGDDKRDNEFKNLHKDKYACEIQKLLLEEKGFYRGLEYPFLVEDFEKEINKILDCQMEFSNFVDENFKVKFLEIYKSKREFWEGPGGFREDQLTKFGRCKDEADLIEHKKNPDYNKFLYEQLIKNCSVYIGQKSVPVSNYYAQRFNFLNDMINISFKIEDIDEQFIDKFYCVDTKKEFVKLTIEAINEIECELLNSKTINFKTIFKNILGVNIDDSIGIRRDAKLKIELTKFDAYKYLYYTLMEQKSMSLSYISNIENFNKIAYIVTVFPVDKIHERLLELEVPTDVIDIIRTKTCYDKFDNRYHSFSEKALLKYIKLMEQERFNSSKVEREFKDEIKSDVLSMKVENYFNNDKQYMSTKYIDDLVASPQVKKSLRKAIVTFNQIKKEYCDKGEYQIEYIVVESNAELLSSKKQNEYIEKMTGKKNERDKAIKLHGNDETKVLKQMLLNETSDKCIYCETLLKIDNMEIEHVLPFSISADDSFANKVASCKSCNDRKQNQSAMNFMKKNGEEDSFTKRVNSLKISSEKVNNLLNDSDINKYEKKFINRNLRDTSYATKEFMNQLRIYMNALEYSGVENNIKLVSMPPKITGLIRKVYPKDREAKYHHAFDASIAAYFPTTKLGKIAVDINNNQEAYWKANSYQNVLREIDTNKVVFRDKKFEAQLASIDYTNTRFIREISKNYNGQLANADIKKVVMDQNNKYQKIEYISSIYELEDKDLKKYFGEKSTLCMKHNDKKTFDYLIKIYDEYKDKKYTNSDQKQVVINPFIHYCIENNDLNSVSDFVLKTHGIRPFNNPKRPIIKKVNYTTSVTMPYLMNKKNVNKKESNMVMLDSLSNAYTKVLKDNDTNKFVFLPISSLCLDLKTGNINEEHPYYKTVYSEIIGNKDCSPVLHNGKPMILRTNDYVRITKKDGTKYEGLIYGYHKNKKSIILKSGFVNNIMPSFASSDLSIQIIPVYGLGRRNLNIE